MSAEFFKTFPLITYNSDLSRNIILRAGVAKDIVEKYGVFYPYRIRDHERMDTIAFDYYGDSAYFWLIALANDIVDPYTDWPMSDHDFTAYIKIKYGTIEAAQSTVHHYENTDPQILWWITQDTRDNLAPEDRIGFDTAVSVYDWETNVNEDRKTIRLLSRKYADRAYSELSASFNNDRN